MLTFTYAAINKTVLREHSKKNYIIILTIYLIKVDIFKINLLLNNCLMQNETFFWLTTSALELKRRYAF